MDEKELRKLDIIRKISGYIIGLIAMVALVIGMYFLFCSVELLNFWYILPGVIFLVLGLYLLNRYSYMLKDDE